MQLYFFFLKITWTYNEGIIIAFQIGGILIGVSFLS